MKKNKLKVETYKIKSWKETVTGLVISENKSWVLVQNVPSDYRLDGYTLYRKAFIKKRMNKTDEKQVERVLKLRKTQITMPKKLKFGSTSSILKSLEKKFGLFEFQDYDEDVLFYGKINKLKKDKLVIDMIKSDGTIEKKFDATFSLNKIRAISFGTDYFNAIVLMMKDGLKK
ncbi:MAG: hypothetical protein ACI8YQ_001333 [Polaribacter sp.]|jgi:hypothetical protein